ncbi:set1 complex component ash2 [Sarocladium implicatum]|nr:set1 complex component ash2 [Sarocladium implicatum]
MSSDTDVPKREPTPPTSTLSSIPQKRALDDGHSPAVPSPLNSEVGRATDPAPTVDDAAQANRSKPSRAKKETLKKREAKGGGESGRATPDPKEPIQSASAPLRYKLNPPKPSDFDPPRGPMTNLHHEIEDCNGKTIAFFETSDHTYNKKNFRYTHCIADPAFPSMLYYRSTEPSPYGPRMSYEDTAMHIFFDETGKRVTTNKGFRMARANVAVREGRWYWECRITNGIRKPKDGETKIEGGKHVRMGWARREASLDAPVGFDAYSYGIRDVSGEKVYMSRPKDFFPPGEGIREGDVIGLEIQLPSERLHRQVMAGQFNPAVYRAGDTSEPVLDPPNIIRDRLPIRFKAHTYFEKIEYHTTKELEDLMNPSPSTSAASSEAPNPNHPVHALRTLPSSCIKVYKNGQLIGTAFEDLLGFLPPASRPMPQFGAREGLDDGMLGYYPAVSVFRGGSAEVNFGPDFWCPPPAAEDEDPGNPLKPLSERFMEQIAEDVVYDIVDEVDFWMQDGAGAAGAGVATGKLNEVAMASGGEEIKELVEED